jgi:D-cysteine desulfhydrase
VKRDDETSARYGGSKVRKLEWILANPPFGDEGRGAADGPPILTVGAFGSHHLLALALFLPEPRELHALVCDQPATRHALDDLAALASQRVRFWSVGTRAELPIAFARHAFDVARGRVPRAVFMPPGASTPLGGFGYVEAGLELASQVRHGVMPRPDRIYVTGGTAGASAGLLIGLALAGMHTRLHVVSAVESVGFNRWLFESMVRGIWAELNHRGLRERRSLAEVRDAAGVELVIDHRQVGQGYAYATEDGAEAVRQAHEWGLTLDTTYTGKCLAALLRDREAAARHNVRRHEQRETWLFWNTHAATDVRQFITPGWRERVPERLRAAWSAGG